MAASKPGLDGEMGVQPVLRGAAEDDPVHRVAVDRLLECLPQSRARGERRADVRVRQVADTASVPDVDEDASPAEPIRLDDAGGPMP